MSLDITTFSNRTGGNVLYKALAHPLTAAAARALWDALADYRSVAIYDPLGQAADIDAFYPLRELPITAIYVQRSEEAGRETVANLPARPVSEMAEAHLDAVFVLAFDAQRLLHQLGRVLDPDWRIYTLDALKLPKDWVSDPRRYLSPINFATNFALFRDSDDGLHTRLTTANYWSDYGADAPILRAMLFDADGRTIAQFDRDLGEAGAPVVIDSRQVRADHALDPFEGQLFLHVTGAAGHDVVKYALDTLSDDDAALSATHDANAWPAERYAGLPTPGDGERVTLWIQNSHPVPIPARALGLVSMDGEQLHSVEDPVPPFATRKLEVPGGSRSQVALFAGKHVVRPRYEIEAGGRRRIAHLNVVREDLEPDAQYHRHLPYLGKGYILPAPILPSSAYVTQALVTPMSKAQGELTLVARVYDAEGSLAAEKALPAAGADRHEWLTVNRWAEDLEGGHVELSYDHQRNGPVDGWLHAIFRYRHRDSGHGAETSFGSHLFNSLVTYRREPQSYSGPPPGLSTRLFVRTGPGTTLWLIYPCSTDWYPKSDTRIELHDAQGQHINVVRVRIPINGSRQLVLEELFDGDALAESAYAMVRDNSCRLFGYHGLRGEGGAFSIDHLFGF